MNVASAAHQFGTIDFDDLMRDKKYDAWKAYGRCRLGAVGRSMVGAGGRGRGRNRRERGDGRWWVQGWQAVHGGRAGLLET